MSDRILVMREGLQMGVFERAQATQETIITAAMGQQRDDTPEPGSPDQSVEVAA